jgi:ribonuclease III
MSAKTTNNVILAGLKETNNTFVKKKIPKNKELFIQKQQEMNTLPFNPNNIYLNQQFIVDILTKYGIKYGEEYTISDMNLFQLSFIHDTYLQENYDEKYHKVTDFEIPNYYPKEVLQDLDPILKRGLGKMAYNKMINRNTDISKIIPLQTESYERQEFLGDSHLGSIISTYLFKRYNEDQGFMTKLKTNLVNGEQLAKISNTLGFNKYVIISYFGEQNGERNNQAILEDCFEAFIGALYLDMGVGKFHLLEKFIVNLYENLVDFSEIIENDVNYKGQLLEYYHSKFGVYPIYKLIGIIDKGGRKVYKVGVCIQNRETKELINHCTGEDVKKKKAEQLASKMALIKFGVIKG